MAANFTLGTAVAKPGTVQYGEWQALTHPTAGTEYLPVVLVQGNEAGPCIWLTAGIHGPEHAGPLVLHKLITPELAVRLRGTIVAIPALSPAGLRTMQRKPYHAGADPNRLWPDGKPARAQDPDKQPPSSLETAYAKLFDEICASADYMIDYHNAWIDSLSFVFRDRYLYRPEGDVNENIAAAEGLLARQSEMISAYGHTVVNEFPVEKYIDEKLHRSTRGAVFLVGGIPSMTVELGTGESPNTAIINAAVAGTRNVLRFAGMLDDEMEPIEEIKVIDPGFPVRRRSAPHVTEACVVEHLLEAGDFVSVGQPIATIRDVWGRPVGEGVLHSEYDGIVVGRQHGIFKYPGEAIYSLAIRDDAPLIAPYPDDYFKESED